MFVTVRHSHPNLIFAGKLGSLTLSVDSSKGLHTGRLEEHARLYCYEKLRLGWVTYNDKHSNLLRFKINYSHEKLLRCAPRCKYYQGHTFVVKQFLSIWSSKLKPLLPHQFISVRGGSFRKWLCKTLKNSNRSFIFWYDISNGKSLNVLSNHCQNELQRRVWNWCCN